jgi:hypothetical protein
MGAVPPICPVTDLLDRPWAPRVGDPLSLFRQTQLDERDAVPVEQIPVELDEAAVLRK